MPSSFKSRLEGANSRITQLTADLETVRRLYRDTDYSLKTCYLAATLTRVRIGGSTMIEEYAGRTVNTLLNNGDTLTSAKEIARVVVEELGLQATIINRMVTEISTIDLGLNNIEQIPLPTSPPIPEGTLEDLGTTVKQLKNLLDSSLKTLIKEGTREETIPDTTSSVPPLTEGETSGDPTLVHDNEETSTEEESHLETGDDTEENQETKANPLPTTDTAPSGPALLKARSEKPSLSQGTTLRKTLQRTSEEKTEPGKQTSGKKKLGRPSKTK
jgi:hypothetical protein